MTDETEASAKQRLIEIEEEIETEKHRLASLREQWEAEKMGLGDIKQVRADLEAAELEYNRLDAAIKEKQSRGLQVREEEYQQLYELDVKRRRLEEAAEHEVAEEPEMELSQKERQLLRQEVTEQEIAEVVSSWTGIPVTRMVETEREKLLLLEDRLHQRVIGQDAAVESVSDAVRRSRSGLQDPNRPIGSFVFLGPTGVGKTELCKALAEVLFDDENAMVRVDMSEFMERHTVSRLIGAPPGYVGYEEGGKLTEAVRRRPYSVVLLDEIEKAHTDVFNILLQVLDDGRLTDNHGHTVDFTNTIIVMTSNMGSQHIQHITQRGGSQEEIREAVMEVLQARLLPEFINRIDETIVFSPLEREEIRRIVDLQIERLEALLARKGISLVVTEAACNAVAAEGYEPMYGARPLKRVIQQRIQNALAKEMLKNQFGEGDRIKVDYRDDSFVFARIEEAEVEQKAEK